MDAQERAARWYEIVEDKTLRQGDIFLNLFVCSIAQSLEAPRDLSTTGTPVAIPTEWAVGNWIVMSASCDLDRGPDKYPYAVLCRVHPALPEGYQAGKDKSHNQRLEVIRKGYDPQRFLLAEHPRVPEFPLSFALFRPHITLPLTYLEGSCSGKRLRLNPPHREAFGNWVGANFSRVGIEDPQQIPRFVSEDPSARARLEVAHSDALQPDAARAASAPTHLRKRGGGRVHAILERLFGRRD